MPNTILDNPALFLQTLSDELSKTGIEKENSTIWTATLKQVLKKLLASSDGNVAEALFSDRGADTHEFLLDFALWDRSSKEKLSLAVESEWLQNLDRVEEDFWKLLVVKAPVKLLIVATNREARTFTPEALRQRLDDCLLKYRDHVRQERYLFIDFAPAPARQAWWIEIPQSGELSSVPDRNNVAIS